MDVSRLYCDGQRQYFTDTAHRLKLAIGRTLRHSLENNLLQPMDFSIDTLKHDPVTVHRQTSFGPQRESFHVLRGPSFDGVRVRPSPQMPGEQALDA